MPRDGPKAVPKGKGPVSQEETKIAQDDNGNAPETEQLLLRRMIISRHR